MFYKSIRFKITVLYMAMLALTLASFSAILYHNVQSGLYARIDTLLQSRSGGIANAIDTYWQASHIEAQESGVSSEVSRKRRNINFARIAERWVAEESTDPTLLDIVVKLFDTDGGVIAVSKNAHGLPEVSGGHFLSVLQGRSRFDTASGRGKAARVDLRIYTTPVFENEKVAYIVQVAIPLTSIYEALNNLKMALFILLPVTVLLTGILGAFLAKMTLRPVESMINTIHQITARNMKLRLSSPGTRDEIQELAETFNTMLSRLEDAFRSERQLFEDVSHELKTPLTILKGEFEITLKKARSREEYEAAIKSALDETNRIIRLAENLLVLARLESKEAFLEKKPLDIGALVQSAVNSMRPLSDIKDIRIFFKPPAKSIVNADEYQMKTMFLNLLDNAIKYTRQKGEIWVDSEELGGDIAIRIKDNGIGIPEDRIGRIFDRFYRGDIPGDSPGFGLGLSIVRAIAQSHGGKVLVKSAPSAGTTFTVVLPVLH